MFGWINDCTECLVVEKFGEDIWHQIKVKAGCEVSDGGFLRYKYYHDSDTVGLVVAASEVLGISVDDVLYAFGDYFIDYVKENGYSNVLECLGNNLRDWLSNLNSLHDHLQASYPEGFIAPTFWSEDDPDHAGHILVHYNSRRGSLLVPLVHGLLKKIARTFFDLEIVMGQLQLQDETEDAKNTTWRISTADPELIPKLRGRKRRTKRNPAGGDDATLTTATTATSAATNYEKTFREGGAQAANLRIEEFVKRSFYNENSELFHALTMEQYTYLVAYWKENKIEGKFCYETWSIQDGVWASLKDLPTSLNPETIDSAQFGGKVPKTGAFPPTEDGTLQSFPPKVRVVNESSGFSKDLVLTVDTSTTLEDSIYNNVEVEQAQIKEFPPEIKQEIDNGSLEMLCVIWNDITDEAYHSFALTDLKTTTTKQLYDLVPKNFDPIKIVLKTTEVMGLDEDEEDI